MPLEKLIEVIEKYLQLIESALFSKYAKNLTNKMQIGLARGYQQGVYEPSMVFNIEDIINEVNGLSGSEGVFSISTRSIFIHGNKSQVEFEYYGEKTLRELGDLIFIVSIIYNGKINFQKITLTQFKKAREKPRWYFGKKDKNGKYPDKEQLYLLAKFPTFKGARSSIVPMKEYNLPNYSGCLGSYGLLFKPGDFAFASANVIDALLVNAISVKMEDIARLGYSCPFLQFFIPLPFQLRDLEDLFYICYRLCRHSWRRLFFLNPVFLNYPLPVLGNCIWCCNLHEFTQKYLMALIGEPIFAYRFSYNQEAFQFLQDFLAVIRKRGEKEGYPDFLKFLDDFRYPDDGGRQGGEGLEEPYEGFYEGGGIGIIHTVINLGEG